LTTTTITDKKPSERKEKPSAEKRGGNESDSRGEKKNSRRDNLGKDRRKGRRRKKTECKSKLGFPGQQPKKTAFKNRQ